MKYPLLVAYDAGPSVALDSLLIENTGWKGYLCNAGKQLVPDEEVLRSAIENASVVIVGMSSEKTAAFEQLACRIAVEQKKPLVFFCDTFGCYVREWFAPWREQVGAVFVVSPAEVAGAQAMYPHTRIVASGNPAWETFFASPLTAEEDRTIARAGIGVSALRARKSARVSRVVSWTR